VVHCTADEKGKRHVRGVNHVIACPKVPSFGTIEATRHAAVVRLAGGLEPKAVSPPGLNVYKY
jgi:hypothetical protein